MDWKAWHEAYEDPASSLSRRLAAVQAWIGRGLDAAPPGEVRVVSMCAGQGRDLLGVLPTHRRAADVRARLVELDPDLADQARAAAASAGLADRVEVVTADAGDLDAYGGFGPAALVLVCGVFGNIVDDDIRGTIAALPQLCAPGATVVWTRHRKPPDVTPSVRSWFAESGFEELGFDSGGSGGFGVGAHRLVDDTAPQWAGTRLFTFVR